MTPTYVPGGEQLGMSGSPFSLAHRLLAVLLATALSLVALFALAGPAGADSNVDEVQFTAFINAVRARAGVPPLAVDTQLVNVARVWSSQMAGAGGISHNPALASQISNWRTIGENVGMGGDVTTVEAALEASPHHYENMVDPAFQYVGVGVVEAGGSVWVTEDFKQSKSGAPSVAVPQPAPPPSPKPPPPRVPVPPRPAPAPGPQPAPASGSAASPAAVAAAHASDSGGEAAPAAPAPSPPPLPGSGSAKHSPTGLRLNAGLLASSLPAGLNGPRVASLVLFAVLAACAVLISRGRLPLTLR